MFLIKKKYTILFLYIFILIFIIIFIEIYARLTNPSWHEFDKETGWILKKNFNHTYKNKDSLGAEYISNIRTNKYGLRYNSENSKNNDVQKIDILVIGDSFTADPYVSNEKMWYSVIAKNISSEKKKNINIMAGGGGGYTTSQELLLSRRLSKIIKPDIFILQFCSNDWGANIYEVEKNSNQLNQFIRRPFIINNKIIYDQSLLSVIFRQKYVSESKILNKLLNIYNNKVYLKKIKKITSKEKNKLALDSIKITSSLLKEIRNNFKYSQAFMVTCDNEKTFPNNYWKKIALKNNFIPIENGNTKINSARENKLNIHFSDNAHWNELGNNIFGEGTYQEMKKYIKF
jgi:lysophospholipase L1-like esterase